MTTDSLLVSRSSLAAELSALGLRPGDVVCVHAAMSRLGWVCGGAQAVIEALCDAVGPSGTIMMPTFSGDLSDPEEWGHPPAAPESIETILREMPPYDPDRTPTKSMGTIPELFRTWPGARRSPHPQSSFAAMGPQALALVNEHPLDNRFGPNSPLETLVNLDGKVLLLAAMPDTLSLFHLTQHMVSGSVPMSKKAPMLVNGSKEWVPYEDIEYPVHWFERGVAHLVDIGIAVTGVIGEGSALLLPARPTIKTIVPWRKENAI